MLERLAAWFLNTYVAEYVGNLNTDQLSIGLLQGAVELEKLPLKKDAFRRLKLPVDIKTGFIGKLKIEIPLTRIKSQAWVVHVDQLYLVAAPSQLAEYNEEEEEARLQDQKQRKLAKLEEQWKAEVQKGSWWSAFSLPTAFLANIVHNIQIKITDVHIRYEDEEACPGLPFAVGVTVESISAQTTNDQWEPTFVTGSSDQKKLFDCRNLSLYWDTNMAGDVESGPELVDVLRAIVPPVSTGSWEEMSSAVIVGQQPSTYIVNPVNGQIRLTWNNSPRALKGADGPRLLADVLLDEVSVSLSERQYHSFLNLVDELQMRRKAVAVAQWRPRTAVREDPASWWRFAYNVVLNRVAEHRRRQSWSFVLARAQLNVRYVKAYTQKLTEQAVDPDTLALLSTVEKELTFEELYLLRGITMAKVNRKRSTVQLKKIYRSKRGLTFG